MSGQNQLESFTICNDKKGPKGIAPHQAAALRIEEHEAFQNAVVLH